MPEVTENYIHIPIRSMKLFVRDSMRTIHISKSKGIQAVIGKLRSDPKGSTKIQKYLFARSKGWTMTKAKAWVKAHKSDLKEKEVIMDTDAKTPQRFKIILPILKTRSRIIKDEEGNEKEERYVEGVASNTELDKMGDRMAPECIEAMANSLKRHLIALNAEHDKSWQSELGDITELNVTDDYELKIEAKLNEMSKAHDLWYALTDLRKKLGLSIGGYVREYEMSKEGEGEDAKWIRVFKDIELDHIAVTSSPANPKTWVSTIAKSLDPKREEKLLEKAEDQKEIDKAKWTRAFINKLPDAAFAVIESGGKKDNEGKTVPRSLRHLPHHNTNVKSAGEHSSVDKTHLRNALARAPQMDISPALKAKAITHLRSHAKALGIGAAAKSLFEELKREDLVELLRGLLEGFNEDQILNLLERSLEMADSSLKADFSDEEEEKKLADSENEDEEREEDVDSEAEEEKESEEESEEKVDSEAEEETDSEKEKSEDDESEDEKETDEEEESEEEEGTDSKEETEETDESEEEEKTSDESDEKEAEKVKKDQSSDDQTSELVKTFQAVSDQIAKLVEGQKELAKKVEELETQPAGRKTTLDKSLNGEDETEASDVEALKKERDEKIAELKRSSDPNAFAKIQKVRSEYAEKIGSSE